MHVYLSIGNVQGIRYTIGACQCVSLSQTLLYLSFLHAFKFSGNYLIHQFHICSFILNLQYIPLVHSHHTKIFRSSFLMFMFLSFAVCHVCHPYMHFSIRIHNYSFLFLLIIYSCPQICYVCHLCS